MDPVTIRGLVTRLTFPLMEGGGPGQEGLATQDYASACTAGDTPQLALGVSLSVESYYNVNVSIISMPQLCSITRSLTVSPLFHS